MNGLNGEPMTAREAVAAIMGTAVAISTIVPTPRILAMTQAICDYCAVIIDERFPEMQAEEDRRKENDG